jgi:hypothetical protein
MKRKVKLKKKRIGHGRSTVPWQLAGCYRALCHLHRIAARQPEPPKGPQARPQ